MKKNIQKIIKQPFIRSVLIMATGTMAAQIVKMALIPIITRIYGPEAYGVMGVFMSIIQIIIPVAALTYPIAIVLPKNDVNAKGIMKLSIMISFLMVLISSIGLLLFHGKIIDVFNIEKVSIFIYLIPIVIMFSALMQVSEQWYIRTKQFSINAKATFYQSIIIEGSKAGIGLFYPVSSVLVFLTTMNYGAKAALMFLLGRKSRYVSNDNSESKMSHKEIIKKYKDFPLLRAPQAFIEATTQSLPILLLTSFFTPASAGFFTLCRTVLTLPTSLIGKSVGDVFYPRINEAAQKSEKITFLLKKAVLSLSGVGIIPFGLIIVFGPWLFELVFGDSWVTAGEYARWMALSSFFRFINEPCLRVLPVLSAQSFHLISTIVHTFSRIIALILGFYVFKDDKIAITLLGSIGAVINLLIIVITLLLSRKFDKRGAIIGGTEID